MSVAKNQIALGWVPLSILCMTPAMSQDSITSSPSQSAGMHLEAIPHQPNFLGVNICIGVEAADGATKNFPVISTSRKLGSQQAKHRLQFAGGDEVDISEDLVDEAGCNGLSVDDPRWKKNGTGLFCVKSWTKGKFVKVSMEAKPASHSNLALLENKIYAVGPCQIGSIDPVARQTYGYGEALQVGPIPVRRSE
jgi:hypothetical protein